MQAARNKRKVNEVVHTAIEELSNLGYTVSPPDHAEADATASTTDHSATKRPRD